MTRKISCMLIRGGTSKGVFLNAADLPGDPVARDRTILEIFGSPDARQINGLGGADPLTSKVAIVSRSEREDCDLDYLFGQVGIDSPEIGYLNNCGNLSSAVGVFAIESGILKAAEPKMKIRIFNINSGKRIVAELDVADGQVVTEGDFRIDGVPGKGAPIRLTFCEPSGAVTGSLLPTGNASDKITLLGKEISFTLIDCGNLYAFIPAEDLGLIGDESPAELEKREGFEDTMSALRLALSGLLVDIDAVSLEKGKKLEKGLKLAIVAPGRQVVSAIGETRSADLLSRILNPGKVHKSFAVTGAVAVAGASTVRGSVVARLLADVNDNGNRKVTIGHPQGVIEAEAQYNLVNNEPLIGGATVYRTARCIMKGEVYLSGQMESSKADQEQVA